MTSQKHICNFETKDTDVKIYHNYMVLFDVLRAQKSSGKYLKNGIAKFGIKGITRCTYYICYSVSKEATALSFLVVGITMNNV